MQNDNQKSVVIKIVQIIKIGIVFLLIYSCSGNKKQEMYPDLIETVNKIQNKLPLTISNGFQLNRVEYKDTLFILQYEVDEKEYPFENLVKVKNNRKVLLLTIISASEGVERTGFEQCSFYGLTIKYIFIGKFSHKETVILVAPDEIKQALDIKSNALDVLKLQVEGEKASLPEMINDGMIMTNIEIVDSMVMATIHLDESNYSFDGIENNLDEMKNEIRKSMRLDRAGISLVKMIANAHYGLKYSYVGSVSKKTYDIVFNPDEILLENALNDARIKSASEIVECDE